MATVNLRVYPFENISSGSPVSSQSPKRLHRLSSVRREQGVSTRTAARRMKTDMRTVRAEEDETTDLTLSQLYRWQQMLEVPLENLLCEPEAPLSRPVMERAKLVRIMKTAMSIRDRASDSPMSRMAIMLVEQLIDLMPELEEIGAWHSVGQRRGLEEVGKIGEHPISCRHIAGHLSAGDE
jgi:transcriptional regulator with XRE-family HTH domain